MLCFLTFGRYFQSSWSYPTLRTEWVNKLFNALNKKIFHKKIELKLSSWKNIAQVKKVYLKTSVGINTFYGLERLSLGFWSQKCNQKDDFSFFPPPFEFIILFCYHTNFYLFPRIKIKIKSIFLKTGLGLVEKIYKLKVTVIPVVISASEMVPSTKKGEE